MNSIRRSTTESTTKKPRRWIPFAAALATALVATGCGGGGSGGGDSIESMDPVTIRYSTITTESSIQGRAAKAFADKVDEATDGKITVEIFNDASLLAGPDTLSGVSSGVADAGLLAPIYFPQELPANNWFLKLGSLSPSSFPLGIFAGSAAVMDMQNSSEALQSEWRSQGVKLLWSAQPNVSWSLLCNSPVDSPEDAKGKRVRAAGSPWTEELEALGMVPVQMTPNEMYEGLQRGVIDCVIGSPSTFSSFSLLEVAQHMIPLASSPAAGIDTLVMNEEMWAGLPKDAQKAVLDAAQASWSEELDGAVKSYHAFFNEEAPSHEVVFHDPAAFDEVVKKHQKEALDSLVSKGPEGLDDPQGFRDEYRASIDEWTKAAENDLGINAPAAPKPLDEEVKNASELDLGKWNEQTLDELFAPPAE